MLYRVESPRSRHLAHHRGGRFILLFGLAIGFHIAVPLLRELAWLQLLVGLSFVITLGYAGWITIERPRLRAGYLGLMVLSVVSTLAVLLTGRPDLYLTWLGLHIVLVSVTTFAVIHWTVRRQQVAIDTVFAALSGYYLLGWVWGLAYAMLDTLLHAAFNVPIVDDSSMDQAYYFSFVTLTTLGFGDIVPTHPLTRSLATVEALVGQLYLAVIVARLVALQRSVPRSEEGDLRPDVCA